MIVIEMMRTIDLSKLPASFVEYVRNLGDEPIALMRGRKPIAVLCPVGKHADLENVSVSFNPKFQEFMARSERNFYKHGGFTHEEVMREFGLQPTNHKNSKAKVPASKAKRAKKV